jgi:hypothetical protein
MQGKTADLGRFQAGNRSGRELPPEFAHSSRYVESRTKAIIIEKHIADLDAIKKKSNLEFFAFI